MYNLYKQARNLSWKVLIECRITELPVDLSFVSRHYEIPILAYSHCPIQSPEAISEDGFCMTIGNIHVVFFNDKKHRARLRFTIAHEIGHILLNHPSGSIHTRHLESDSNDPMENQANVFARDLLMPACVLEAIHALRSDQIMEACHVSRQSAEIRARRMELLHRRGAFGLHPLERQVEAQFAEYIRTHCEGETIGI